MRFSIRTLMTVTLCVALAWFPAMSMIGWAMHPKKRAFFLEGLSRCYKITTMVDRDSLVDEWERISQSDYVADYVSGHITGWTSLMILVWGVAWLLYRRFPAAAIPALFRRPPERRRRKKHRIRVAMKGDRDREVPLPSSELAPIERPRRAKQVNPRESLGQN